MTVALVKGQKADVTKSNPGLTRITAALGWSAPSSFEIDTSAFMLAAGGKVRSDNDLLFYGNPSNAFLSYIESPGGNDRKQFKIDLSRTDAAVEKIAITLTIYDGEKRNQQFSGVNGLYIRFLNESTGQEIIRYDLREPFSVENAIVIGELYRYNQEWKFNAIGAGYSGGLKDLCGSYGIEVKDEPKAPAAPTPPPAPPVPPAPQTSSAPRNPLIPPAPPKPQETHGSRIVIPPRPGSTPAPAPSAPAASQQPTSEAPKINFSKIELKKKGDVINLTKQNGGLGEILVNLNWNQKAGGGLFKRTGIDLDLACMYELKDGSKGVIQALGNSFGSLNRAPYVMLDGDDRTGSVTTGENIRINGEKIKEIKRLLIFTFIYKGVTRWSEADGVVTLSQQGGPDIVVKLDEYDNGQAMCAIAMITNVNNETFSIERIVRYFEGHRKLDSAFDWGLSWVAGSK
ncbi:tellurium resistance protein TerA [Paenibacillus sp. BIHB 4019]|uniref:Tellurium resistance protein TerA n=1 Tax=Paenibacillus sp. BIHB 4019 TaxID=1870819 RepID=A0A1B2DC67_9BACL|nr:TerD family protein [Paenibacillus sp. BIHB 4019]ANY65320.1 tellurium resistance protein TerA [Paenibacillus sp. BIHB 4019]